ncbi:carboxylating nicotinate-nucleotide diphosphorylase [Anaplasma phagocytophilum]|uniref:nicotinate-nucleotide diphosphorylase (carboxylating) n=1 Tax=Anaplasma phagocytophilum str. CRT38 TaxID=1269275 RepID=S6G6G1_ANAPH|nr:carboxylating nicotinate-nucleotide diphosphorylase [Anaplasma phagocytophilum]EOA62849.1 nicotinate-nucleotide pyrophosphorylase [Anaplasma phagocytophilum str. CRT38]
MFEYIIQRALEEDLGTIGDITTDCIIRDQRIKFEVNAREELIVSGMLFISGFANVLHKEDISFYPMEVDGTPVKSGTCLLRGEGSASKILSVERVLLNFIQRASGISSLTRQFVEIIHGTNAIIRSTRKTCPGLRKFDLYAVHVGGGESFRTGLFDGVLIKDNHIASCSGISECVHKVREKLGNVVILVECDTTEQVEESILNNVNTVMLDNMSLDNIKKSVSIVNSRAKIEVSGGVNLNNVRAIAECGVDYISVGCITNAVKCKDIGLDVIEQR